MTTLEKLLFCKEHGITISYIANKAEVVPATLSQWIKGEKGISSKNEMRVERALRSLVQVLYDNIGGIKDDGNI